MDKTENSPLETKYSDKLHVSCGTETSDGVSWEILDRFHTINDILEELPFSCKIDFHLVFKVLIFNTKFFNVPEVDKTTYCSYHYFKRDNELDISFRLIYAEVEKIEIKDLVHLFFEGIDLIKSETEYRKKAPKGFDWDVFWQEFNSYIPYIIKRYKFEVEIGWNWDDNSIKLLDKNDSINVKFVNSLLAKGYDIEYIKFIKNEFSKNVLRVSKQYIHPINKTIVPEEFTCSITYKYKVDILNTVIEMSDPASPSIL